MQRAVLGRLQAWLVAGTETRQLGVTVLLCLIVGVAGGALFALLGPILAVAVLVAFVSGLAMLRSTQLTLFALVAFICLLPFAALPVPDIGFSPTFLDLVLAVLLFSWLFQLATKKKRHLRTSALGVPIVIFMGLACASFVIGLSFGSLTTNLLRQFAELLLNIFLFFLVLNNVESREQLQQILAVLIVAGLAVAVIGLVLYYLPPDWTIRLLSMLRIFRYPAGSGVLRYIEENPDLPLRATSTSIDPNVLGGMLAIVAATAAPQLLAKDPLPLLRRRARRWGVNWALVPVLAIIVMCLLLTYSRAAMGGLAVAVLAIGLLRYRKLLMVILLAGLVMLVLPQTQWYLQRSLEGLRGEDLATRMRFGEYKDALVLIARYPWFGVGFAGAPDIDTYLGVSSIYLLIAEQMGLIGLVVFLWINALAIRQILRWLGSQGNSTPLEPTVLGLFAGLLAALSSGVLDHYFVNLKFQHAVALFWLCLGLAIRATQLSERGDNADVRARTAAP